MPAPRNPTKVICSGIGLLFSAFALALVVLLIREPGGRRMHTIPRFWAQRDAWKLNIVGYCVVIYSVTIDSLVACTCVLWREFMFIVAIAMRVRRQFSCLLHI